MNIQDNIENLTDFVHSEVNEDKIVKIGGELLDLLRKSWQFQKEEFTEADIQLLQEISSFVNAVQEFTEITEVFPYLASREDIDETIAILYSVVEKVDGFAVAARVQKETRELLEKRVSLPSREAQEKDLKLSRGISRLDSSDCVCKKCGAGMVIREGNGSYFWGCSTFPSCWGKSWLTKEELSIIQG